MGHSLYKYVSRPGGGASGYYFLTFPMVKPGKEKQGDDMLLMNISFSSSLFNHLPVSIFSQTGQNIPQLHGHIEFTVQWPEPRNKDILHLRGSFSLARDFLCSQWGRLGDLHKIQINFIWLGIDQFANYSVVGRKPCIRVTLLLCTVLPFKKTKKIVTKKVYSIATKQWQNKE